MLEGSDPFMVVKFDNMDGKAFSGVVNHIRSNSKKAALLLNVDGDAKRVMHQCVVPKVPALILFL
jgi:hypothetical protein